MAMLLRLPKTVSWSWNLLLAFHLVAFVAFVTARDMNWASTELVLAGHKLLMPPIFRVAEH
jgi:hypothetical protein